MSKKRKQLPIVTDLTITDVAAEGNAIGKIDDFVVFIPFGAPGDVVDAQITKKKKSFAIARIERMVKPSPDRLEPRCRHFTTCGGCAWQHLPYEMQLKYKQKQVQDALDRIAKVPHPELMPILGSESIWQYRNKLEYTFSDRKWLTFAEMDERKAAGLEDAPRVGAGFHLPGCFDKVLDIDCCHLQEDFSNEIRNFIKNYGIEHGLTFYNLRNGGGLLRTLMVRTASTGEKMIVLALGEDDPVNTPALLKAIKEKFPEITAFFYTINTKVNDSMGDLDMKLYAGKPYIEEDMDGLRYRIGPKSFYQTNSRQAVNLYKVARDFASLQGDELVYDLYTGTGTIANFLSRQCRKVIGIEYVPEAIADARINAEANGITNTEFFAGDMKDVLTDEFIAEHGRPDVMIVDPPRAGMHQSVVDVILNAEPKRIVYVSCNAATQARDIALLNAKYDVTAVRPVDMFPHTAHVENVVRLELR